MTSIQTTGQLPELSSALLTRLSAAWGMSPDETRALWAQASDAVEAQAEQDAEEEAFQRWWDGEIVADSLTRSSTRQIAHEAWMYRASIHREEEGTIIADIEARTNNTSIEMDRVTAQLARARAEVERLQGVANDLDAKLQARTANTSNEMDHLRATLAAATNDLELAKAEITRLRRPITIIGGTGSITIDGDVQLQGVVSDLDARAVETRTEPTGTITAEDLSNARIAATDAVLRDVAAERDRQFAKWGLQRHPMRPPTTGTPPVRIGNIGSLGIISSNFAKHDCEKAFEAGRGTFAHILVEEVAEAIDAPTLTEMRAELIQVAAVAVQMVEAIDADSPDESSHDG